MESASEPAATANIRKKTSFSIDAALLAEARTYGLNVSAIAEKALKAAVQSAAREAWLKENAAAFEAQARWHEENGNPLAGAAAGPLAGAAE